MKKQGLWTYYYESGVIKKESLGGKIINYDIDGDITEIIEGYFADKMERPKEAIIEDLSKEDLMVQQIIDIIKDSENE